VFIDLFQLTLSDFKPQDSATRTKDRILNSCNSSGFESVVINMLEWKKKSINDCLCVSFFSLGGALLILINFIVKCQYHIAVFSR